MVFFCTNPHIQAAITFSQHCTSLFVLQFQIQGSIFMPTVLKHKQPIFRDKMLFSFFSFSLISNPSFSMVPSWGRNSFKLKFSLTRVTLCLNIYLETLKHVFPAPFPLSASSTSLPHCLIFRGSFSFWFWFRMQVKSRDDFTKTRSKWEICHFAMFFCKNTFCICYSFGSVDFQMNHFGWWW